MRKTKPWVLLDTTVNKQFQCWGTGVGWGGKGLSTETLFLDRRVWGSLGTSWHLQNPTGQQSCSLATRTWWSLFLSRWGNWGPEKSDDFPRSRSYETAQSKPEPTPREPWNEPVFSTHPAEDPVLPSHQQFFGALYNTSLRFWSSFHSICI